MASDLALLLNEAQQLRSSLQTLRAANVNRSASRAQAEALVQTYFREVRSPITGHVDSSAISKMDAMMQRLLTLSKGRNARTSYLSVLRDIIKLATAATFDVEKSKSDAAARFGRQGGVSGIEQLIYDTLSSMLPTAANSYRQAIADLSTIRYSYRGPAIDLREALREVLDYMAPDADVMASPGYKHEAEQSHPTMAQKARYIMKQREKVESIAKPTWEAAGIIDAATAKIARSTYVSGSVSVHVSPTKAEVQQLKLHVDSTLAELLGIFVS